MSTRKLRILLDLDCVLADFIAGVAKIWGIYLSDLYAAWTPGEYPMDAAVGHARGLGKPVTTEEFWHRIELNSPGFWKGLSPLPWAAELLRVVRERTDDWWIVTAPSRCPTCIPEKREWCRAFLGMHPGTWFDRFIPTPHKELFAKPGVVLIDDHEKNVDRFFAEGGSAVLFPAHHNYAFDHKDDPMAFVNAQLARL